MGGVGGGGRPERSWAGWGGGEGDGAGAETRAQAKTGGVGGSCTHTHSHTHTHTHLAGGGEGSVWRREGAAIRRLAREMGNVPLNTHCDVAHDAAHDALGVNDPDRNHISIDPGRCESILLTQRDWGKRSHLSTSQGTWSWQIDSSTELLQLMVET